MIKPDFSLAAVPVHDRPRERLVRLGSAALTDAELLALVLGSGRPGSSVVASAQAVLAQVGGFRALVSMDARELQRLPGIGVATAGRLVAAAEMWRRASEPRLGLRLADSSTIAGVVLPELAHRRTERFVVLAADRSLRYLGIVLTRAGGESKVTVDPAEVLRAVLDSGGSAFAVAHNHPGGSINMSVADAATTLRLRLAAETTGLRFLDHILVAGDDWSSIA